MESFALQSVSTTASLPRHSPIARISLLHRRKTIPHSQSFPTSPCLYRSVSLFQSAPPIPQSLLFISRSSSLFNPLFNPKLRRTHQLRTSASQSPEKQPLPPTPLPQQGAKPIPFLISIAIGLIVRFAVPKPVEVSAQAWQLLSIFLSTIAGLVLSPLPVGAWAFLGLTMTVVTKTLTFTSAFNAFTSEVIWLIVISFFFARGFVKTGLGDRIATYFVKWMGKSTLGLSYGLTFSEALIAPAMPSTTARAGGVFLPIIKSLSLAADSKPNDPSSKKIGAYLIQSQFQSAGNSSALFLTAAAQNLLCLKLAEELGVQISSPWLTWAKIASVPAIICLLTTPAILYKLFPPETKNTPDAPAMATKKLEAMGPVTKNEWVMVGTMLIAVSLWIAGEALQIPSVVAAMIGLSTLLTLGVLNWEDCLAEKSAWDTLAWFAVLVGMAGQLTSLGLVGWMSNCVASLLKSLSLSWPAAFAILQLSYFFVHYLFASQTGHVGALYSAFLAMHLAAKVPGVLAALALAYNTNLFGALTHYSSGQAAVYYGAGYVDLPDVFKIGFVMALVNGIIWIVAGGIWWKVLGLY
ncbi:dicarboxylate transporter 2.1, chloroplastic-like [Cucurbita maxima]|uniref:Dicarboxylate transporter 2.1, chloroplastic-like n=1 Tax=Cucurbita maxima TaxID=3661 RepID=A0A6J1J3Q1_CUCMA|nr:dicarboxylate transporter 2.1, chloroplastic-like [Cucurbita maxima]